MSNISNGLIQRVMVVTAALFGWRYCQDEAAANPSGGKVFSGSATFNNSGSVETITTSGNSYINWSSFNIGAGETTTFVEPSSSSVVWNNINGASPSQILGNLNANGYVILQNQAGFYVGGQAAITAHGLVMTTGASPAPNLSSGGAWEFDAPPPTAKIINYGQINIAGGGSAFLIADNIENDGTISAPSGKIGLYAGEKVLVSMSPDGRGLSSVVTLPQGSVDNEGRLIADGGAIVAQAQTVNQNGLVQANSVQNVDGTIELLASESVNLGANSAISAQGDSTGVSSGGSVTIKPSGSFADQAGSSINVSGGSQGGNGGEVEISAPQMSAIQSSVNGQASPGYVSGELTIDPANIWLSAVPNDPNAPNGYTSIDINSFSGLSINLQADDNIELNTLWSLPSAAQAAALSLAAGNNITLDDGAGILAGKNWTVSLAAGTAFTPTPGQPTPASGNDGIYLNGDSYVQTFNGNINLSAANEIIVNDGEVVTGGGGSINATTVYGDINTGLNTSGYTYSGSAPYYGVSIPGGVAELGGISTAAGGNVDITAGKDVISYDPSGTISSDAGSGAFGPEGGNVSITAGGNVYGHYVLANGVGTITAGGNAGGGANGANPFALSLINGIWNINAPEGSIYLQEVRNPNGVFNGVASSGGLHPTSNPYEHYFNYAPTATVNLDAGIGVDLTGLTLPRLAAAPIQVLYPPILNISAGSGGITLESSVTLFPSLYQNLDLTTTAGGSLVGVPDSSGNDPELLMSDSSQTTWVESGSTETFNNADNGSVLPVNNPHPVDINIAGNMDTLNLITDKAVQLSVGGNINNCGFSGQNLSPSDITSITVGGEIINGSAYSFINLMGTIGDLPSAVVPPGIANSWSSIFLLALNPQAIANLTIPAGTLPSQYLTYALVTANASLFGVSKTSTGLFYNNTLANFGFIYNSATSQLGFDSADGHLSLTTVAQLTAPLTVLALDANGIPETYTSGGHTYFKTTTVQWGVSTTLPSGVPAAELDALAAASQTAATKPQLGYTIGGPGQFVIQAGAIDLGDSPGIFSSGSDFTAAGGFGNRYANLASLTPTGAGASLEVEVSGDLTMLNSSIATLGGGDLNVISTGGTLNLGLPFLNNTTSGQSYGLYTVGGGNVNVTALGDVDIAGSRVATFNGGNIFIESLAGNVNVGSGGDTQNGITLSYVNPVTGQAATYAEDFFGSGILAFTLSPATPNDISNGILPPPNTAAAPGDITVLTPHGDITSSEAGIQQIALDGSTAAGPVINLIAGSDSFLGNIVLGGSGVIGGSVNASANGNIDGNIISRQNSNIQAQQNFNGSVVAAGSVSVNAGGNVTGNIVGIGGANVSGGDVTAAVLGQNVSVNGGASTSTLGTSASATSASQSAAQQSSSSAKQQVAVNSSDNGDDSDDKRKKKPGLMQRIKRVTVILPKST